MEEERVVETTWVQEESRTKKSVLNTSYSIGFYFINVILGFVLRKYTIGGLGPEITGMQSLVSSIFGYLSLVDLGIGGAIGFMLYKPLFNKDRQTINEIVTIQAWFYRKFGYATIILASIIMAFFPLIFKNANLPEGGWWLPYVCGISWIIGSVLGYFYNYKIGLMYSDQKGYKMIAYNSYTKIAGILIQIAIFFFVKDVKYAFISVSIVGLLFSIAGTFYIKYVMDREYPWLKINVKEGKALLSKHRMILTKSRQVLIQKLGGYLLGTSPTQFIMYKFLSLSIIVMYDNYMILAISCLNLLNNFYGGLASSIGNLIAEGNTKKVVNFYWEMTGAYVFNAGMAVTGLLAFCHPFIQIWLGKQMLLSDLTLFLIAWGQYVRLASFNGGFLYGYGLVHDTFAIYMEGILFLLLSFFGAYLFRYLGWNPLDGILIGLNLSFMANGCTWKPYFLFTQGFKLSAWEYVRNRIKYPVIVWGLGVPYAFFIRSLNLEYTNIFVLLGHIAWSMILFALISAGVYYALSQGFRDITHRVLVVAQKMIRREAL